jgi:hypothetical protein
MIEEKTNNIINLIQMDNMMDFYKRWLLENDFPCEIDEDGDLRFSYQKYEFFILHSDDDHQFFHVLFPNIWSIENENERQQVLEASNYLNISFKMVKALVGSQWVSLSIEMYLDNTFYFEEHLTRILDVLIKGRDAFAQKMLSNQPQKKGRRQLPAVVLQK